MSASGRGVEARCEGYEGRGGGVEGWLGGGVGGLCRRWIGGRVGRLFGGWVGGGGWRVGRLMGWEIEGEVGRSLWVLCLWLFVVVVVVGRRCWRRSGECRW